MIYCKLNFSLYNEAWLEKLPHAHLKLGALKKSDHTHFLIDVEEKKLGGGLLPS